MLGCICRICSAQLEFQNKSDFTRDLDKNIDTARMSFMAMLNEVFAHSRAMCFHFERGEMFQIEAENEGYLVNLHSANQPL